MHPNAFLKSLWRSEIKEQIFVAMSFEPRFNDRYEEVIRPAIEDELIEGQKLSAYRVDNSKTGDSILTDIIDNIAHSKIVLADVSVIDEGRFTQVPIRNGNVMYEVGVALASRSTSEVLLIRDDNKKFLFDVSTIPHLEVDFSNKDDAIIKIRQAISDRVRETNLVQDARVSMSTNTLTQDEKNVLDALSNLEPNQCRDLSMPNLGQLSVPTERGVSGLLRKGCIKSTAFNKKTGAFFYSMTPFGYAVQQAASKILHQVEMPESSGNESDSDKNP
jgi:hypothetical protein